MTTQLNNIIELAAQLIIEGKATKESALQMAIEQDNNRIADTMDAMADIQDNRNIDTYNHKFMKGIQVVQSSVTAKLYATCR